MEGMKKTGIKCMCVCGGGGKKLVSNNLKISNNKMFRVARAGYKSLHAYALTIYRERYSLPQEKIRLL